MSYGASATELAQIVRLHHHRHKGRTKYIAAASLIHYALQLQNGIREGVAYHNLKLLISPLVGEGTERAIRAWARRAVYSNSYQPALEVSKLSTSRAIDVAFESMSARTWNDVRDEFKDMELNEVDSHTDILSTIENSHIPDHELRHIASYCIQLLHERGKIDLLARIARALSEDPPEIKSQP